MNLTALNFLNPGHSPARRLPQRSRAIRPTAFAFALTLGLFGPTAVRGGVEYIDPDSKTGESKAVIVDRHPLAHTAQLLPLNPRGDIIGKNDPTAQISQVLAHLETNLREAQSSLADLVKLNFYAAQTDVVAQIKQTLAEKFSGAVKPAVSFVITSLPHPDALVALDAVAISKLSSGPKARRLRVDAGAWDEPAATVAILPAGAAVYVSGQAERGELAEATRKTMESLLATLSFLKLNRLHIVQLKAFMRPISDVAIVRHEIGRFVQSELLPPMVFVEWVSTTPIEIELIASASEFSGQAPEGIRYLTPPGIKASPLYSRIAWIDTPRTIYVSGLFGTSSESAAGQIGEIFQSLQGILEKSGSDFRHLVKATYYVATDEVSSKLNELRPNYYDPVRPPAASKAMVRGVSLPGKSITLDMIAVPATR